MRSLKMAKPAAFNSASHLNETIDLLLPFTGIKLVQSFVSEQLEFLISVAQFNCDNFLVLLLLASDIVLVVCVMP